MLAKVHAFVLQGIDAVRCEVGVDRTERAEAGRKPTIVGLPDVGVKECVDRIRAALFNCGYGWPEGRLVINLAPADLKKEGNALELPIALGILGVCRVIKGDKHKRFLVAGEGGGGCVGGGDGGEGVGDGGGDFAGGQRGGGGGGAGAERVWRGGGER